MAKVYQFYTEVLKRNLTIRPSYIESKREAERNTADPEYLLTQINLMRAHLGMEYLERLNAEALPLTQPGVRRYEP